MDKNDFKNFCQLVAVADESMGGRVKSDDALSFMFKKLSEYNLEDVAGAIDRCMSLPKNGIFFPDILEKLKGKVSDNAAYAWSRVIHGIKQHGRYASITFGDPKVHYCIHVMGGWNTLCDMLIDEQPFRKKDFMEIYRDADSRGMTWGDEGIPRRMLSLIDIENAKNGYGNQQLPKFVDCGRCNVAAPPEPRRAIETKKPDNTLDFSKIGKRF